MFSYQGNQSNNNTIKNLPVTSISSATSSSQHITIRAHTNSALAKYHAAWFSSFFLQRLYRENEFSLRNKTDLNIVELSKQLFLNIDLIVLAASRLICNIYFFYLGFVSRTFTNYRTAREGGGHSISSSLPLPPASQTLRHQPGDYCRELTSAHSQQPDLNREPLVSERKSLTTKLSALRKPHFGPVFWLNLRTNYFYEKAVLVFVKIDVTLTSCKIGNFYERFGKKARTNGQLYGRYIFRSFKVNNGDHLVVSTIFRKNMYVCVLGVHIRV